jgi:hypothetical protein
MKLTVRSVAARMLIITAAMIVAQLIFVRITVAEREASVQVNHYKERSYHYSLFACGKKVVDANGQKSKTHIVRPLDQVPMGCEGAAARLDFAVIEANKLDGAYLIIIARLGTGEVSSNLNQTRLAVAKEYVLRRGADLKYVLAQGERVKGLGRLELYVGGKLYDVLPLKRNAKGYCLPEQE